MTTTKEQLKNKCEELFTQYSDESRKLKKGRTAAKELLFNQKTAKAEAYIEMASSDFILSEWEVKQANYRKEADDLQVTADTAFKRMLGIRYDAQSDAYLEMIPLLKMIALSPL